MISISYAGLTVQRTFIDLRNPGFSSFLDMSRWIAALLVFVGHLRNPLFLGYGDLIASDINPLVQSWYLVTGWFGEAVIVFFVLSGYLVGGVSLAKYSAGTFDPVGYASDRFSRLYIAFLPALLLTLVLDLLGSSLLGGAGLYDGSQEMFSQKLAGFAPLQENLTFGQFFGTLFMLQHFYVDSFGSNSPLWTISSEFWFYVVFGITLVVWTRGVRSILPVLLLVALFVLLGSKFLALLGLWLIGAGISLVSSGRRAWRLFYVMLFFSLLVFIRVFTGQLDHLPYFFELRNYAVAISFALLLHSMRDVRSLLLERLARLNKLLADFSFSLYLIHFPLMIFMLSALYSTGYFPEIRNGYRPTDPTGLVLYFGIIVSTFALAWLFAQGTEKRTYRLRKWLQKERPRADAKATDPGSSRKEI